MRNRRLSQFSFSNAPAIRKPRTLFNITPFDVKTSINVGELTPIGAPLEVYPGDTFNLSSDFVSRLSSAYIRPVMDTLVIEFAAYFVPLRLLYDKVGEVLSGGSASPNAWHSTVSQEVPHLGGVGNSYRVSPNTVMDYLGVAPGVDIEQETSILPVRGFAKIWDDWYRNENFIAPLNLQVGELTSLEFPNDNAWSVNNYFGKLPRVGKRKDYFTSALPGTQKGSVVDLLDVAGGFAPLITRNQIYPFGGDMNLSFSGATLSGSGSRYLWGASSASIPDFLTVGTTVSPDPGLPDGDSYRFQPLADGSNLGVNLPDYSLSVNDLRYSVAVQRILEALARGGNRYTEMISSLFGVASPDARLQRSEFLGGASIPLAQQAVDQTSRTETSESGTNEYLGTQAAYSLSNGHWRFSKAFTEHGYIYVVACVRQAVHNYQQGLPALYNRISRFSFFVPQLSYISEQPIYKSEIWAAASPDTVFGYKEAWSELRYFPNQITGNMRSSNPISYDVMHFGDKYNNPPVLGQSFIEETSANIDRTLQVESSEAPNFLLDVLFSGSMVRVLPPRSIPGFVDHI